MPSIATTSIRSVCWLATKRQSIRIRCRTNVLIDTMSNRRLANMNSRVCHSNFFCTISLIFSLGITVFVNVGCQYQSMLGFGGAFTNAARIKINSLSVNTMRNIFESYYGNNGIPEHRMINKQIYRFTVKYTIFDRSHAGGELWLFYTRIQLWRCRREL